jgi:oligopeptide/dipeptide ABC transporter ATP-binding protein
MSDLINVENLFIEYPVGQQGLIFNREQKYVKAVQDVSFKVKKGTVLGIVGESGCGKSSLVRGIMGLTPVKSGRVDLLGKDLTKLSKSEMRDYRRHFQMIFQDSEASLNPRMTVGELIGEPLTVFENLSKEDFNNRVIYLMKCVGLEPSMIRRFPHEFSGGQRQRICIARALSLNPELIVCDEAVSALDVSIQAQVINLLNDLKDEFGLTYLFISHDLAVTRYISDEIMVMYLGKVVERGKTNDIIQNPQHPYTKALISAIPQYGSDKERKKLEGEIPSPLNPPKGCAFSTRCSEARPECFERRPALKQVGERDLACHLF